jgi:pimeloyl-ACP methyl ester carboxylesterase
VTHRDAVLHGHPVSYAEAGPPDRPTVVLLHGIAGSSHTWDHVVPLLATDLRVIAPDLLGHGASAKPRGDYSLGAFASGVRDLLDLIDIERVTVVGHSLGGGVAMQFAYQFPERCERLVLVSSGGLGREVTPLLRAATLPGAEFVVPWLGRLARKLPLQPVLPAGPGEVARGFASLAETDAGRAFVHTARSVIDLTGQRVDASDRLYLAATMPTLLIWGDRDRFIPIAHGRRAAGLIPGSRLEEFRGAGHFPMHDNPLRFARLIQDFVATAPAATYDRERVRDLVRTHAGPRAALTLPEER